MSSSRDNFSKNVKRILAERVGYRCSFPNCSRITIGPNSTVDHKSIMLGEAAHIYSASNGGPRPFPSLTVKERSSYENGIWLCKQHARLIDVDEQKYSAETLKKWKTAAEAETYRLLKDLEISEVVKPTTLIFLDLDLMFEGFWKSAVGDTWTIVVKKYVFGSEQRLRDFTNNKGSNAMLGYIIIESQGDGRLIKGGISWTTTNENEMEIQVQVLPKYVRKDPNHIGSDLAHGPDGDILIENGDFKRISGMELAKQIIERNLSLPLGTWIGNRLLGSFFSMYYNQFEDDLLFLNRIIKIEITRLLYIPVYQSGSNAEEPELNFINRINEVDVGKEESGIVPLFLSLEWGNNTFWSGVLHIRLAKAEVNPLDFDMPDFIREIFEPKPIRKFKKLINTLDREPMKERVNDNFIFQVFNESIPAIMNETEKRLEEEVYPFFKDHNTSRSVNGRDFDFDTPVDLKLMTHYGSVHHLGVRVRLFGLTSMGTDAFDEYQELFFYFNPYNYEIGKSRNEIWHTRLYHRILSNEDILGIADEWFNAIVKNINARIEWYKKGIC